MASTDELPLLQAEQLGFAHLPDYAELHCVSCFSFQRGGSHPEELVERAHALGYRAIAITDECSVAGVVRACTAWKKLRHERGLKPDASADQPIQLLVGSEFLVRASAEEGGDFRLVALACNREGYGRLSEFITRLRMASPKGRYRLAREQVTAEALQDNVLLLVPPRGADAAAVGLQAAWAKRLFDGRVWVAAALHGRLDDGAWLQRLHEAAEAHGLPLVASGDVLCHVRSRQALQDVMTAIDLGCTVAECGRALQPHAERHLKARTALARLYPEAMLQVTLDVAARCHFSLGELAYDYPQELVPAGQTPTSHLRTLTLQGMHRRWPQGAPDEIAWQIGRELQLIAELGYEKFFLTVEDVVRYARSQGILCQGRGSAANSAVCYCLGITEVDPARANLLFERFISKERGEPPDIDVDFEHQRREEVIQYLYGKYGRHRTALAATVIRYRTRSAVRDVGKALGMPLEAIDGLAKSHQWWESAGALDARVRELGLDPQAPVVQQWLTLTRQLKGMPRHLSQHVGGFVIAADSLGRLVPTENAAMDNRSVIQWDKDDLESLGLLKVDVLALGMLTAIRRSLTLISQRCGYEFRMQDIEEGDGPTYDMICKADTIGVFQIESRAQMSMLPRLRPRTYYDLVVQVSIVRPGPIEGGMVHPYLKSRLDKARGKDVLAHLPDDLKPALARTNGVPIFQEQVMQIVMLGADFSPGEADQLRRAMASWKSKGHIDRYRERVIEGLTKKKDAAFAESIFRMILGFGEYGFPESHAAGFALLAYVSAWIKCHEPAAFLAGLLNSQPLGFYSPSQLVQDAKRHGVEVRAADVSWSEVQSSLEDDPGWGRGQPAVRLGLDRIAGLGLPAAGRIVEARAAGSFADVDDLARRADLTQEDLRSLASGDALASLAGHRRQQVWEAAARHRAPMLLRDAPVAEPALALPAAPEGEEILFDYASLGLTLRRHPLALLRPRLARRGFRKAEVLLAYPEQRHANRRVFVQACGIVTMRQQPETAKGTIFVTLEDETGSVNVIVHTHVRDRCRHALLHARLLAVQGIWQRKDDVRHLIAEGLEDLSLLLGRLATTSRDFH